MNRRYFLSAAGTAAASAFAAPAVLRGRYRLFARSAAEYSERTIRLLRESPVVDMLCQFAFPDMREQGTPRATQWMRNPNSFTAADFERMKGSGVKSIALGTGAGSYEGGLKLWADWNGFIASRSEWFTRVDDPADVASTRPDGKIGIILSTQGADHFRTAADVETFYQLGQRVAQLTYNFQSRLGAGFLENRDGGLTVFGAEVVAKMEQVGMAVDLSHCADQTTMDAIAAAKRPPIFTHATARTLLPECLRCKTDEAVKALAAKGGVIGVAFIRFMIRPAPPVTVTHVADHVDYLIKLVGAEHVGIGSDLDFEGRSNPVPKDGKFDGSNQPNFSRYNAYMTEGGMAHVDGMDHPKRLFDLTEELIRRKHSDETVKLVLGGSFIRVLGELWK
jgi:membrane dipeptidase